MSKNQTIAKQECKAAWRQFDDVQDLRDRCPNVIWDFGYILLPKKPSKPSSIINWGKNKESRKFPYHSKEKIERMEALYIHSPDDEELQEFLKEEDRRRMEGLYFYNEDRLEYVTGDHYMFLQYWKIPVAKNGRNQMTNPKFRDMNRDFFYAADKVKSDPYVAGLLFLAGRRSGKTAMSQSIGFFDTTAYKQSRMAIQSKTDPDAKIVFLKLVSSWKRLPLFLMPSDSKATDVKKELNFAPPRKVQAVEDRVLEEYLYSTIFYTNAKQEALDGNGLSFYFCDEIGKCGKGIDVYERWNISKECVISSGEKVGFAINTTTVEDMEKFSSDKLLDLWNDSAMKRMFPDDESRKDFYSSSTDMSRLFFPAYYGWEGKDKETGERVVNEWGYTNIRLGMSIFQKNRDAKSGNNLLSYMRKYPMTIDDCFAISDARNLFNQSKILEQKIHNDQGGDATVRRGNFYWKNGEKDGEVAFADDKNGKWLVAWFPPVKYRNKKEKNSSGKWKPSYSYCRTGSDPFSHAIVKDENSKSDGCGITTLKHIPGETQMQNAVVCYYLARPDSPTEFCEDMLMQSVFYSSPHLSENNKDLVNEHFRARGYGGYLMTNPVEKNRKSKNKEKRQDGMNTTSEYNREALMNSTMAWINEWCGWQERLNRYGFIPFNKLLDDLRRFESANWGPYDSTVGLMMSIMACKEEKKKKVVQYEASDWFPTIKKSSYSW